MKKNKGIQKKPIRRKQQKEKKAPVTPSPQLEAGDEVIVAISSLSVTAYDWGGGWIGNVVDPRVGVRNVKVEFPSRTSAHAPRRTSGTLEEGPQGRRYTEIFRTTQLKLFRTLQQPSTLVPVHVSLKKVYEYRGYRDNMHVEAEANRIFATWAPYQGNHQAHALPQCTFTPSSYSFREIYDPVRSRIYEFKVQEADWYEALPLPYGTPGMMMEAYQTACIKGEPFTITFPYAWSCAPPVCFDEKALVRMADDKYKPAKQLQVGDSVATDGGGHAVIEAKMVALPVKPMSLVEVRGVLFTPDHPVGFQSLKRKRGEIDPSSWKLPEELGIPRTKQVDALVNVVLHGTPKAIHLSAAGKSLGPVVTSTFGQNVPGHPDSFWGDRRGVRSLRKEKDYPNFCRPCACG